MSDFAQIQFAFWMTIMITLYGFGPHLGVLDPSPFVLKVDAYLRIAGFEYEFKGSTNYLRQAPKGKLPYLQDKGVEIGDSQFIFEYLKNEYGDRLDKNLSDEQRAIAHFAIRSLDEDLYLCLLYSRWVCDDTWPIVKKELFGGLPFPLRKIIPPIVRKGVVKRLKIQGLTAHSEEEIGQICERSLSALAALLGDKSYFFGEEPSSLDAASYGFLAAFITVEIDNALNRMARGFPTLVAFCERVEQAYYSE